MRYFIFFLVLILVSCYKDLVNKQYTIKDWTQSMTSDLKLKTELRLGFGKAVANAFGNQAFRKYFHDISIKGQDSMFNEILFAVHKDDIVENGKTVAQIIGESADSEVRGIFGDSLVEKVLQIDQCVCMKIPDLLFELNWNPKDFAPCVYVETPQNLNGLCDYQVYHESGYQGLINDFEVSYPLHYYVMVKYSEDYSLIDTDTWLNEKGISFTEFMPQLGSDWEEWKTKFKLIAEASPYGKKIIFIPKYKAYEMWIEKNAYNGPFLSELPDCGMNCLRKCHPSLKYPTVLENFNSFTPILFHSVGGIFRESQNYFFQFHYLGTDTTFSLLAIPGLRSKKIGYKASILELDVKREEFDNLGEVIIPFLKSDFDFTRKQLIKTEINFPIFNSSTEARSFQVDYYWPIYNDIVIKQSVFNYSNKPFYFNTTIVVPRGNATYRYCYSPTTIISNGNMNFKINY